MCSLLKWGLGLVIKLNSALPCSHWEHVKFISLHLVMTLIVLMPLDVLLQQIFEGLLPSTSYLEMQSSTDRVCKDNNKIGLKLIPIFKDNFNNKQKHWRLPSLQQTLLFIDTRVRSVACYLQSGSFTWLWTVFPARVKMRY